MTRLTALLILGDPDVYATSYGPIEGKFGVYIGTYDRSPSGSKRPRTLLTSEPLYGTAESALAAAEMIIAEVKGGVFTPVTEDEEST